jgi:hypothetical protein
VDDAKSTIPKQLWIRLFRGKPDSLAAGGNHLTVPGSACWVYYTTWQGYDRDKILRNGTLSIPVDLRDQRWLNVASSDPTDEYYTVVFETGNLGESFRLNPELVKRYFDAGLLIKVPAEAVRPPRRPATSGLLMAATLDIPTRQTEVNVVAALANPPKPEAKPVPPTAARADVAAQQIRRDQATQAARARQSRNCIDFVKLPDLPEQTVGLVPCRQGLDTLLCPAFSPTAAAIFPQAEDPAL